jgi:hypothetical protein
MILPRSAERVGLALEGRRFERGKMALPPPGALSGVVKSPITICADPQSQKEVAALCTSLATPARCGINRYRLGRRDGIRP